MLHTAVRGGGDGGWFVRGAGDKQLVCCTRQYLAVVTVAPAAGVAAAAPPRDHLPAVLQVFDLRNKLLAGTMQAGILYLPSSLHPLVPFVPPDLHTPDV